MPPNKLSGLFSVVKEVHCRSTNEKLQVEKSFKMFKDLLMAHSVQRPPYSIGLFSYQEMTAVVEWFLDTYYRHYKLYIYAFTKRVLMNSHPLDDVELPSLPLQPLNDAMTEEEHAEVVEEETKKREEEDAESAAQRAEEEEAARKLRLREEYEASIPEEVKEKVAAALERELGMLKKEMEEKFDKQTTTLRTKIEELEAKGAALVYCPHSYKGLHLCTAPTHVRGCTCVLLPLM
eukprot:gene4543-14721_t